MRRVWGRRLGLLGRRLRRVWIPRARTTGAFLFSRAALTVVVVMALGIAWVISDSPPGDPPEASPAPPDLVTGSAPPIGPVEIRIPRINLRAPIRPLGLAGDGTVEVPPEEPPNLVGWYQPGAMPGDIGAAVLFGHRDALSRTAAFYYIDRLRQGDRIEVVRQDRAVARFTVDSRQIVRKSEFPTDQVYDHPDRPVLRLVTCYGKLDRDGSYQSNLIVFASADAAEPARGDHGN